MPESNYNIKSRRNQLLYKPLLKHKNQAAGYGAKIILDALETEHLHPELGKIKEQISRDGVAISVKKEALIYKFPTQPTVKMELARLEVLHKIYFSLCIEGKSLNLVETITEHLLEKPISCDYVTFLKNILHQ